MLTLFRSSLLISFMQAFNMFVMLSCNLAFAEVNSTDFKAEVIRVIQPGVFDYQTEKYLVRMRAWGVNFPKRGQPGYQDALSFTERKLISTTPKIEIKREFDHENLKVVNIELPEFKFNFSQDAISQGIGWHDEEETGRLGSLMMAQLKARRLKMGIWKNGFDYQVENSRSLPTPKLPSLYDQRQGFLPSLTYWVTTFGKIHRPGCSFYERGRGTLTSKPKGTDCRICGGQKLKR